MIHFGDVVDVDFVGSSEYDWRGGITPAGELAGFMTFDSRVNVVCRSVTAIAADIAAAYGKMLREPKVVVTIIDRSNRAAVQLIGAVKTPTRFRLMRPVRLRELIVRAGGFTDDIGGEISLFRPKDLSCQADGGQKDNGSGTTRIKISDLLKGDEANVAVLSGDMIEVERAATVYVIGAVNNPRPVYSKVELTVTRAVASAGGLAKDASGGKLTIFRRGPGGDMSIEADLDKIKRGESADVVLEPFDIIDVAGKGGRKRKLPPVAAKTQTSAGQRELPLRVID